MKSSNGAFRLLVAIVIPIATALGGYWIGTRHGGAAASESKSDDPATTQTSEEDKPVVTVVTAPLTLSRITETAKVYGTVVAEAAEVHAVSVPFESRLTRVLVTPGQQVSQGTPLVQVEASPDALVGLQEAKNTVANASKDLAQTQQRLEQHLATNIELSQAQQAVQSAKLKLDSLEQRGVGEKHELKAEFNGIVSKVDVQDGQIVAAGSPLVEVAAGNRIEVRLNAEPSTAQSLKLDDAVQLMPVDGAKAGKRIEGKVRMIGQRLDPATRLVEVRVSLPPDASLLLDSFVTGDLKRASAEGFVVPRDAALPNEDGTYSLFTAKNHHAIQHSVNIGLQQDKVVQVIGDDLRAGDLVVVTGNSLLKDGMEVEEQAATEPATQSAAESSEKHAEVKE